jgi:hypothetical protein
VFGGGSKYSGVLQYDGWTGSIRIVKGDSRRVWDKVEELVDSDII